MTVTDIANEIYLEWGEPNDISIPSISYYLIHNIGKLNIRIDSCYEIVNEEISPELGETQKQIYKKIYEVEYLKRRVNNALGAASLSSVQTIKDGARTVTKFNKNEIAKTYLSAQKDAAEELTQLVLGYKANNADPRESRVVDDEGYYTDSGASWPYWRT